MATRTATFTPANLEADDAEEQSSGSSVKKPQFSLNAFKPMTLGGAGVAPQSNFLSLSGIASPAGAAVRPVSAQDNVNPLAAQQNIAAARTAGTVIQSSTPIRDRHGNVVRMDTRAGGTAPSNADWMKPGAPGWQAQKAEAALDLTKTGVVAGQEGAKLQTTQALLQKSGQDHGEYFRTHNYDGSEKSLQDRVAATGIDGLKPIVSSVPATRKAIQQNIDSSPGVKAARAAVQQNAQAAASQQTNDQKDLAETGPIAVDPRYAGAGQFTGRDAAGKAVGKFGVQEGPDRVAIGGLPTKFTQGAGVGVDMAAAGANPTERPLDALQNRSLIGGSPKDTLLSNNQPAPAETPVTGTGSFLSSLTPPTAPGPDRTPVRTASRAKKPDEDEHQVASLDGIKNPAGT